jgi:hypothetical protein
MDATLTPTPPPAAELQGLVMAELEQILRSAEFRQSEQFKRMLRYLVEHSLEGNPQLLKERAIGVAVFGLESGYDTNENPIVRVRANEIRKRLAKYSQHAPGAPVRLEVPSGGYRVEFELHAAQPAAVPARAPATPAAPAATNQRWKYAALGLVACAALTAVVVLAVGRAPDPLQLFWQPALDNPSSAILCSGHPVLYRFTRDFEDAVRGSRADNFQSQTQSVILRPEQVLHGRDVVTIPNQYVGLGSAEAVARIAAWLSGHHKETDIRFGNDLSFTELRKAPTVLIGAFQNRWTVELTRGLRFVFASQGRTPGVRDMQTGKLYSPVEVGENGRTQDDYVVISRVLKSASGEFMVVGAGITQYGGHTVAEVLSQPRLLKAAARKLRPGWEKHNLQLLYHVQVIGETAGPPELIAAHEW